jgi:membrane associated rhomboid family serine protease
MRGHPSPWFEDKFSGNRVRRQTRKRLRKPSLFGLMFEDMSITSWLIWINVLFFIIAILLGVLSSPDCSETVCNYIAIQPANFFNSGYVWTLLTSMFMHGGLFHLFINMFVLFSLGGLSEKIIGRKRFLWFYILSGIFAGLVFVFMAYFLGNNGLGERIVSSPTTFAVGASGAIFAIAGLFVVLTPKLKFYIIFLPFFSLPAYIMIPLVLFLTWIVSSGTGLPVGNTAHFGGLIAGLLYGFYLKNKYKRKTKVISELFSG